MTFLKSIFVDLKKGEEKCRIFFLLFAPLFWKATFFRAPALSRGKGQFSRGYSLITFFPSQSFGAAAAGLRIQWTSVCSLIV